MFAEASKLDADVEDDAGNSEDEAEPEDDFNAACEILDLARDIQESHGWGRCRAAQSGGYVDYAGRISFATGALLPRSRICVKL